MSDLGLDHKFGIRTARPTAGSVVDALGPVRIDGPCGCVDPSEHLPPKNIVI